jgi:GH25 family lysozyme M1 (1,4-beta-N-acetylmuramidase)
MTTTAPALAAPTQAQGVDVASFQHPTTTSTINWASVAAAGAQFTGIKVSEGNYYTNPYYAGDAAMGEEADAAQALAAGLYVTPYVFANPYNSTPTGNGTAVQQADYAVNVITGSTSPAYTTNDHMLGVTVDLEPNPYGNSNQCYGLSTSAMVTWISQFLGEIKTKLGTSKTPIIYTTANWWNTCTGSSTAFSGYPLWLASYGVTNPALPAGWSNPTIWQYSASGSVSGISGSVDLDELAPVLQVSQSAKAIGAVKLRTLTSLAGQADTYSSPTGLPPGLTVASNGQITGTPTTNGSYTVTVPTSGVPSSMSFTWDVHGTITVTSPGNRTTTAGAPVWLKVPVTDPDGASYPPTVTGSGLPPGMAINKSGVITGWPTMPGTHTVHVSASDALYGSGSTSFTWTIAAAANTGFTGLVRQVGGTAKCLTDPGAATANGTLLTLSTCTGGTPQAWTTVQDGTIRAQGKCLTVFHSTTVELYACAASGSAQQQWRAGTDSELINAQYGTCLYFPNANATNGSKPTLSACQNSTSQTGEHWSRTAANVVSPAPGKCMAASGTAAGSAVVLAGCSTVAAERWVTSSDGTIRLGAYCLTEAGTTAGSALTIGTCSGAATTKWNVVSGTGPQEPASPIATEIASANSASSGMCVSTPVSGSKLSIQACSPTTATPANTWHIE